MTARIRLSCFASSALTLCIAAAAAPSWADADGGADNGGLQEVVVTARKRAENAQDVPIALTAIAGDRFSEENHYRIDDINQLAPSVNIVIPSPHLTAFSVRGIGNNPANDGLEQSAGIFLDGIYLGRPGMAVMDLMDLQGIEVLRGPQGTLFGKNTTAGALSLTTQKPSFTPGVAAQISEGNYGFQQYQAMVTGPLADSLAGRLTAYDTKRAGWIDDTTTGQTYGNLSRAGVRGQLLYQPTEEFSVRLIGEMHEEDDAPSALLFNNWGATPAKLKSTLASVGATIDVDPSGGSTAINSYTATKARQYAASGEINWDLGGYELTSITAFRSWFYHTYADADGTNISALTTGGDIINDRQYSEELRIATPKDGPVDAVAGLYYYQQDLRHDVPTIYGPDAAELLSGMSASTLAAYAKYSTALKGLLLYNNTDWDTWSTPDINSYAAFAQATWHAVDRLDITAGLRETYERKDETVWRPVPYSTLTGLPVAALKSQAYPTTEVGLANWSPSALLTASYKATDDVMGYATVSHGEKAGGLNSSIPGSGLTPDSLKVRPEKADDAEIGVKTATPDHRLQWNADAFITLVRDYQTTYYTTPPGGGSMVQVLSNAGAVRTQGFETDLTVAPFAGMTVTANGSYNDAYYQSYANGPCPLGSTAAVCSLTGKPVSGAPRWIANLSATYEHALDDERSAYISGDWSWRSSYYGYLDDSAMVKTGDFAIVNLRVGVRQGDNYDLSFLVKNLFDRTYVNSYFNLGSLLPGVYSPFFGDRMTLGGTLRVSF
jgi:iron complex outermembrane receptor protein